MSDPTERDPIGDFVRRWALFIGVGVAAVLMTAMTLLAGTPHR
jgi:low affinity Fe/Cu permease